VQTALFALSIGSPGIEVLWNTLAAELASVGSALAWRTGAAALLLAPALLWWAARLGWLDPRPGSALARKTQVPAAPVGGLAMALALAFGLSLSSAEAPARLAAHGLGPEGARWLMASLEFPPLLASLSLLLALALGCLDDLWREGLGPLAKLGGQAVAALPWTILASETGYLGFEGSAAALLAGGAALAAMNLVNTWDNSDGAALSLGAVAGLAIGSPALLGASLGLLPWNLRRPARPGPLPQLYLGDGGSHLLGMALAIEPAGLFVLIVPALDLLRLSIERPLRGSRPWIGDRRHLAHLLAQRGWPRPLVLLSLVVVLLPSVSFWFLPLGPLLYLGLWLPSAFAREGRPAAKGRPE
jgi:UDP-N-acetylmuramyl pentapeptide phosphotransferase/UDP-N-acetylglucosamine-1-phosphate transferase